MLSQWKSVALCGILGIDLGILAVSTTNQTVIADDSFFYGQSLYVPPVLASGLGDWAEAHSKAVRLVSRMTLEEKANVTIGYSATGGCTGRSGSVPRLGWPGLCMSGGTNGMRSTELVNGWPNSLHVGASWNRELAYERGFYMGGEFREKGANLMGGPTVGALGRVALGGRNAEGFSNDPYLSGQMAAEVVNGSQAQGVIAIAKHYIGNEQESYRLPPLTHKTHSVSSNIDDRTMHELYLWPFADAIRAGAGAVMCSYNRLNNSYACQNSKALNGLLKGELGFQGLVLTDWYSQQAGVASAEAGLDLALPVSYYWGLAGETLTTAVQNGSLSSARLTDMATRVVASWYHSGQDSVDYPPAGFGMTRDFTKPHRQVNARNPAAKKALLAAAIEGHVLVKNIGHALPLRKPQLLSLYGYDAPAPSFMNVPNPDAADSLGVVLSPWGSGSESANATLVNMAVAGDITAMPPIATGGTIVRSGGAGANSPAYISSPFSALEQRAYSDDFSLFWDFESLDPTVDTSSDACLVFTNAYASEGADRPSLRDDASDALIINVAKKCANTIVIIHNAGVRLVDQWIDNPNITAVIFGHLPGQDSGRALAQILFGDVSPSGKLPYTVAKNESDYNVLRPSVPEGRFSLFPQSDFTEGRFIDYRYFDLQDLTPRYEFGYGLSYTTFNYSEIHIQRTSHKSKIPLSPAKKATVPGGNPALWEELFVVSATITNTGTYAAQETAQLYVKIPGADEPVRQLRGFEKKFVPVGGRVTVKFSLTRKDLSVWDVQQQEWLLRRGEHRIYVGSSSRNLPLEVRVVV
ncbi:glycoside hydrolase superfamily [Aspergillus californicus]